MKLLICDPANNDAIKYLKKNGIHVDYAPQISSEKLLNSVSGFDALLVRSRTKIYKNVIEKSTNLKIIGRIGSGYDNIDIEECSKRKIRVINAPDANSYGVAELTIALIISLLRKIEKANRSMREGLWLKNEIWGEELNGKTVGVLGYGYVGKKVIEMLKVFNCRILIYSLNFQNCTLPELFSKSDIISVHVSLNKFTYGLIDSKLLSKMKKSAYLINIARGEIINENDLFDALSNKRIAGCALDVFWKEPLPSDSKWRKLSNVLLTPHIGAATINALERASMTVAEDLVRFKRGQKPKFQVV